MIQTCLYRPKAPDIERCTAVAKFLCQTRAVTFSGKWMSYQPALIMARRQIFTQSHSDLECCSNAAGLMPKRTSMQGISRMNEARRLLGRPWLGSSCWDGTVGDSLQGRQHVLYRVCAHPAGALEELVGCSGQDGQICWQGSSRASRDLLAS